MHETRKRKNARRENAFADFLVKFCDEDPSFECTGVELVLAYERLHYRNICPEDLTGSIIYQFAIRAGCTKSTRPNNASGSWNSVFFTGVTPNWEKIEKACGIPVAKLRDPAYNPHFDPEIPGPYQVEKSKNVIPMKSKSDHVSVVSDLSPGYVPKEKEPHDSTISESPIHTHIMINDTMYDRGLIATFRKIKGFQKRDGTICTHIVTFHNPEIRHQFVDQSSAEQIQKFLSA